MSTVLLFSLGLPGGYEETDYCIGENTFRDRFSALALYQAKRPDKMVILATAEAQRQTIPQFQDAAARIGLTLNADSFVSIPDGRSQSEIYDILDAIISHVDTADHVILDITNSFRHIPFIYFSAVGFLTSLKQVTVEVYYAAFERGQPRTAILDLTDLVTLNDWHHALRNLQETGDLHRLAERIRDKAKAGRQYAKELRRFANWLLGTDEALAAGLPLEAGLKAAKAVEWSEKLPAGQARQFLAVGAESLRPLLEELRRFAMPPGIRAKEQAALDSRELERQLVLVDWYLEHGQVDNALRLMREWVVNRVLWAHHVTDWLDRDQRARWEHAINAASRRAWTASRAATHPAPSGAHTPPAPIQPSAQARERAYTQGEGPEKDSLLSLWGILRDARNGVAHAGFQSSVLEDIGRAAESALQTIQLHKNDDRFWRLERQVKYGRILLTPLGRSTGLIYTAVLRTNPEGLLVVTSQEALHGLRTALEAAGRPDLLPVELGGQAPNHVFLLNDPYTGYSQVEDIRSGAFWREVMLYCRELICSITGGTTVLQWCVSTLANEALRHGIPVRTVAMVDRRPHEEQQQNPFVCGEMITLGGVPGYAGQESQGAPQDQG
ncbi:MAG: TIGR02221 family CRISPR-associated protein [Firmicutes bacterium]|nr:TIGR02221 family CRISPR-associated protein [Bacillota bacterium]